MSLERLKVQHSIFEPVLGITVVNFILMLIVLVLSTTIFARPSGVQMDFPVFKGSLDAADQQVIITVTSENVIYINGRVVTLNELRRFLAQGNYRRDALMIKADQRASMGRIADILDLCRGIAGASVNVSTIL